MIAQGNGEHGWVGEKAKRTAPSLPFAFGKRGREEEDSAGPLAMASPGVGFFFLEPVSSFPPAPQLSCYLPHNLLLLLFIVYLLNEGGGEGWGLTDSDKPSRSGCRARGCGRPRGLRRAGPGRGQRNPFGNSDAAHPPLAASAGAGGAPRYSVASVFLLQSGKC